MTQGPDHALWADAVGAYLLGALEPDERERFEEHMAGCAACRRDVEDLRVAVDALPVSVQPIRPPAALKQRIMAVVGQEAYLVASVLGRQSHQRPVELCQADHAQDNQRCRVHAHVQRRELPADRPGARVEPSDDARHLVNWSLIES